VEGVFDEALKVMIVISLYRQHHVLALHLVPVQCLILVVAAAAGIAKKSSSSFTPNIDNNK
jgi:hypothetical protein